MHCSQDVSKLDDHELEIWQFCSHEAVLWLLAQHDAGTMLLKQDDVAILNTLLREAELVEMAD